MMSRLQILVILVSLTSSAQADEFKAHVAPILPTARLEANASGKATFKLGADIVWGIGESQDISLSPVLQTTTSRGVSNLFSVTTDAASSAELSVGLMLGTTKLRETTYSQNFRDAQSAALDSCKKQCDNNTSDKDPAFCAKRTALDAAATVRNGGTPIAATFADFGGPAEYCKSAVAALTELSKRLRDRLAEVPASALSGAFTLGTAGFQWIEPDPADGTSFSVKNHAYKSIGASALYTRIEADAVTLEFPARLQMKRSSAATTANVCTPLGNVTRPGSTTPAVAEVCGDYAIGAPTRRVELQGGAYAGILQRKNLQMRGALGINVLKRYNTGATDETRISFESPFYIAGDLFPASAGSFKGLLRITPAVTVSILEKDDNEEVAFTLTLELLVGRSMFSSAIDYLQ